MPIKTPFILVRLFLASVVGMGILLAGAPAAMAEGGVVIDIGSVSGDGAGYTFSGGVVTITAVGDYTVTGTTNANTLVVADNIAGVVNLTLNNVQMQYSKRSSVVIGAGDAVNLILSGTSLMTSRSATSLYTGIAVPPTATLTISGTGALTAEGRGPCAGIGGGEYGGTGGTVVINSGSVTAIGGNGSGYGTSGPGMSGTIVVNGGVISATGGTSSGVSGSGLAGTVTINGGTVTAQGGGTGLGNGGAGIGGSSNESGGTITINGGDVTATGALAGAGIGGGYLGAGGYVCINGGTVVANGGSGGAGIGGGRSGAGGAVVITDQAGPTHVTATGAGGAGIGAGSNASGGSVTIEGGTVEATGGTGAGGAGIGSGYQSVSGGVITVSGGTVTATGSSDSAGIGGGKYSGGGTIRISGGQVTATGGSNGAGVGSGTSNSGITGGTITISGGTLNATGGSSAAGIGGGFNAPGGIITITNGTVTATSGQSGAGIGGGASVGDTTDKGSGGSITIDGGTVAAAGKGGGAGIGGGRMASAGSITINGGLVTAQADDTAAGIGSGKWSTDSPFGTNTVTINGGRVYSTGSGNADIGGDGIDNYRTANTFNGGSVRAGSVSSAPKSGSSQALYKTVVTAKRLDQSVLPDAEVTYKVDDAAEGIFAMTDEAGKLYLWLPQTPGGGATTVLIEKDGVEYLAAGQVTTDNLATLDAVEQTYAIEAISDQAFSDLTEGYTEDAQETKNIRITNTGTAVLRNLSVTLASGEEAYFDLSAPSTTTLAAGASADFTIKANTGLAGGDYAATVTIQADDLEDVIFHVSQTVKLLTVEFISDGETVANCLAHYNVPIAEEDWPADPEKAGFVFCGWFTDGGLRISADTPITDNLTLTAKWAQVYSIGYVLGSGAANPGNPTEYSAQSDDITLTNPTRRGYTFAGWSGTDISGVSMDVTISKGSTGDRTYTATWTTVVYSIDYFLREGAVSPANPAEYTIESDTFTLTNPARVGYTFAGWIGTDISSPSMHVTIPKGSTGDRGYAAKWTANTYTVVYNANGGTGTTAPSHHTYNEPKALTTNGFTRTGYAFAGWSASADGPVVLTDGQTVVNLTAVDGVTVTLYAKWTQLSYSIVYNLNGGAVTPINPASYNSDSAFALKNPTRTGYTFKGWSGTGISGVSTQVTVSTGSTGNRSYTANWTKINYSISYALNGGAVSPANPTGYTIESTTFTLKNPTRAGYTFYGWSGTGITGVSTNVTIPKGFTGNRAYTANWKKTNYSISYTLNGGTVSPANPTGYTVESATFTLKNPTRAGYTFTGWSGTGITGFSMNVTIPKGFTGNRAYTANWKVNVYTIAAAPNNTAYGSVYGMGKYNAGAACSLKAVPKSGCRFVNWTQSGVVASTNPAYAFTVTGNRTLVANFAKIGTPLLNAPTSAGYNSIKLTWPAVAGAKGYNVYRAASSGGNYTKIASVTGLTYTNTGLVCGTTYYYKIQAYCVAGSTTTVGAFSGAKSAKPIPATPTGVKTAQASSTSVKVSWSAVAGATQYEICHATSLNGIYGKVGTVSGPAFTSTGLTKGKTYYFKVRAYRLVQSTKVYSGYSVVVSIKLS